MHSERVIVVLKRKYLGDAVMATPLLAEISRQYQSPTVIAAPHIANMLGPNLATFSAIEPSPAESLRGVLRQARRIRDLKQDVAILVNRSFRSALELRLSGIKRRIGHATEGRAFLLTDAIPHDPTDFEAQSYINLLKPLGIEGVSHKTSLIVTPEESSAGSQLLDGATIGVQPGTTGEWKRMPADKLIAVTRELLNEGYRVALIDGPDEVEFALPLAEEFGDRVVNLVGRTNLRQSIGVVSQLKVMVGGSTGIMHMSAAAGCPTVTVFAYGIVTSRWGYPYAPHVTIQPQPDITHMDPHEVSQRVLEVLR